MQFFAASFYAIFFSAGFYAFLLLVFIHIFALCLQFTASDSKHASIRPAAKVLWQWPPVISGPAGFEVGAVGPLGQRCWVAIWQSVPDGRFLPGTFFGENIYDFVGSADGRHPESALIYNLFVQLVICS